MASDTPDQLRHVAEQPSDIEEAFRDPRRLPPGAQSALARMYTAFCSFCSLEIGDQESDKAQQSMFEDIDAILARVEGGIAGERTAMNALLDRLSNAA